MKRYGWVIGLKEEKIDEYKKLHAAAWPEVLKKIKDCNIQNYSIYIRQMPDEKYYLFSYLEYCGEDFDADMKNMADDSKTKEWWKLTEPMQEPLSNRVEGEWWADMEEVFHCD